MKPSATSDNRPINADRTVSPAGSNRVCGQRLLLVDHDVAAGDRLTDALVSAGGLVTRAFTSFEAMDLLLVQKHRFDAIILEMDLPDFKGCNLCVQLRGSGVQVPIVMLSHLADIADIIRGLEAGANDYLVKPFRIASLLARLRAHARSYERSRHAVLSLGPHSFHPGKRLWHDSSGTRPVRLTAKEAALFQVLYQTKGTPVDRLRLIREVLGEHASADSNAMEAMIFRLRQKIEPAPHRPQFLLKVPSGYCLTDRGGRANGKRQSLHQHERGSRATTSEQAAALARERRGPVSRFIQWGLTPSGMSDRDDAT